ncbi:hypothetical protein Dda_6745 [Drechslerella dactyloides]|uniref:Uncharacterized protein n=1 Tax=Drechslerella dactyloides TaxID=74499 RepID=A0AAD6IUH1_DREDA|nr:hypothetical protein Dda_6745 [Drechslerella dactyloides]
MLLERGFLATLTPVREDFVVRSQSDIGWQFEVSAVETRTYEIQESKENGEESQDNAEDR